MWLGLYEDHSYNTSTIKSFCYLIDVVSQPNPNHEDRPDCPPVKGGGWLEEHGWASAWFFIPPVS